MDAFKNSTSLRILLLGVTSALIAAVAPGSARCGSILPGYQLYQSMSGTSFEDYAFVSDPLGTYNFGNGAVNVGNTDTIFQRTQTVTAAIGNSGTTAFNLVALQLMSASEINFMNNGMANYYITLQTGQGPRNVTSAYQSM